MPQSQFGFDDADGDDEVGPDGSQGDHWFEQQPPSANEFQDEVEPFQFRRLYRKTNAKDTNYSNTALVCRSDFKVLQHLKRASMHEHKVAKGSARASAIRLLALQPELVSSQANSTSSSSTTSGPHHTHDITHLANDATIIYCRVCSAWSLRSKLKCLKSVCQGLKDGNRSRLRLLQCGVAPYPGAKMPSHLSRVHCRGKVR